jgi:hypothetical protein
VLRAGSLTEASSLRDYSYSHLQQSHLDRFHPLQEPQKGWVGITLQTPNVLEYDNDFLLANRVQNLFESYQLSSNRENIYLDDQDFDFLLKYPF